MSDLSPSSRVNSINGDNIPKKEQWALIYQQKAKEFQRLKQLQKQKDREKKNAFKLQLDNQIHSKNDVHKLQKQQDKRYYDYITLKAQQLKQKEERQKNTKIIKRKQIQQQNKHFLQMHHQRSLSANLRNQNNFDIGYKSQRDSKIRQQIGKKTMMDALDKQLQMKDYQHRMDKIHDLQLEQKNNQIQQEYFYNRNNRNRNKNYGQNPNVYKYYQDLNMEKIRKQRQLQHRLVDQAAMQKAQQQYKKKVWESQRKHDLTNQMKSTLDQQVKFHNYKKAQQHRTNPQQNSYGIIAGMFKQKASPYDKRQYSDYLKFQADQQKRKQNEWNHMSQQQYKLNLNQLNKAVIGTYAHDYYQDRSLTAIGQKESKLAYNTADTVVRDDDDAEVVKHRIQNIKRRKMPSDFDHERSSIF